MSLLNELTKEVHTLTESGTTHLDHIFQETDEILSQLKTIESSLLQQVEQEQADQLQTDQLPAREADQMSDISVDVSVDITDIKVDKWYKQSLGSLKSYNGQINRFSKHILTSPKFNINIDEAYTYPLNLESVPVVQSEVPTGLTSDELLLRDVKVENNQELMKAIVLHLLKIGQRDSINDILKEYGLLDIIIHDMLLDKFGLMNEIVDEILIRHDLSKALSWFKGRPESNNGHKIEFKFHILQFVLLLTNNKQPDIQERILEAYRYSIVNFSPYLADHLHEIGQLMLLTVFDDESKNNQLFQQFFTRLNEAFTVYQDKSHSNMNESKFVEAVIQDFDSIGSNQKLFQVLANEFISYYCKDLNLSNDSSLFQSLLAGFINLPSFYKYNQIERKLKKVRTLSGFPDELRSHWDEDLDDDQDIKSEQTAMNKIVAPFTYDLPFQLPDSSRFLFKYHPIFICPVSKEQLVPLTLNEKTEFETRNKRPRLGANKDDQTIRPMHNPVVVLKWCNHVALRDSIWQLSKRGSEIFKCHYCYTKHKFSEVSEAYFIDL